MAIKFVRRSDVQMRCERKWDPAIKLALELGLPFYVPDWKSLRNYEMEEEMRDQFGDDWVVVEWCPFNGIFCRYKEVASKADLLSVPLPRTRLWCWPAHSWSFRETPSVLPLLAPQSGSFLP